MRLRAGSGQMLTRLAAMDVSVYEAKANLSKLLKDVEAGVEVTITRHGRPVARLVPVRDQAERERRAAKAVADFRALRDEMEQPPTMDEMLGWIREARDR